MPARHRLQAHPGRHNGTERRHGALQCREDDDRIAEDERAGRADARDRTHARAPAGMSTLTLERRLTHAETVINRQQAPNLAWDSPVALADALGLVLDGWQQRLLLSTARRVVVLAPRQVGKSTALGLMALDTALRTARATVLVVSPAERQAKEVVRVVRGLASEVAIETAETETPIAPSALSL